MLKSIVWQFSELRPLAIDISMEQVAAVRELCVRKLLGSRPAAGGTTNGVLLGQGGHLLQDRRFERCVG